MPINMQYIRFENTLAALRECAEDLTGMHLEYLAPTEQEAAIELLRLCRRMSGSFVDGLYIRDTDRIAAAPRALMDTRAALGLCALKEEDFPAIHALQGRTVALVVVEDETP